MIWTVNEEMYILRYFIKRSIWGIVISFLLVGNLETQGLQTVMRTAVAWSPNGTLIVTTTNNGIVEVRNTNGDILRSFSAHDGRIISLAWDPDAQNGDRFATGGADQFIKIWDANSGELIATLAGHEDPIIWLSWSVNDRLASLGIAENDNVRIWDTNDWLQIATPSMGSIDRFIWSPDGSQFAVVGPTTLVSTGDAITFQSITSFRVDETIAVTRVDWNPVSQQLVTSSWDSTIRLWNLENEIPEGILTQLDGIADFVQFSPDGTRIAGIIDNQILMWDESTGDLLDTITEQSTILGLDWSPDGTQIAYGTVTGSIIIETLNYSISSQSDAGGVLSLEWSPDSSQLAYGTTAGIGVEIAPAPLPEEANIESFSLINAGNGYIDCDDAVIDTTE